MVVFGCIRFTAGCKNAILKVILYKSLVDLCFYFVRFNIGKIELAVLGGNSLNS